MRAASIMRLGCVVAALVTPAAKAADKEAICAELKAVRRSSAELFYKVHGQELKNFSAASLAEISGKKVWFFYISPRNARDIPPGMPPRGAINVKFEAWDPDGKNIIFLYNNHTDELASCATHSLGAYQAFHKGSGMDGCLRLGFHNLAGDFSTLIPKARREAFLFATGDIRGVWDRFFGPAADVPVRRFSHIYNYNLPDDSSGVCIPFYFTTSHEQSRVSITINDLLENRRYEMIPRLRFVIDK